MSYFFPCSLTFFLKGLLLSLTIILYPHSYFFSLQSYLFTTVLTFPLQSCYCPTVLLFTLQSYLFTTVLTFPLQSCYFPKVLLFSLHLTFSLQSYFFLSVLHFSQYNCCFFARATVYDILVFLGKNIWINWLINYKINMCGHMFCAVTGSRQIRTFRFSSQYYVCTIS